jgi:hypothetical protein
LCSAEHVQRPLRVGTTCVIGFLYFGERKINPNVADTSTNQQAPVEPADYYGESITSIERKQNELAKSLL